MEILPPMQSVTKLPLKCLMGGFEEFVNTSTNKWGTTHGFVAEPEDHLRQKLKLQEWRKESIRLPTKKKPQNPASNSFASIHCRKRRTSEMKGSFASINCRERRQEMKGSFASINCRERRKEMMGLRSLSTVY